MINASVLSLCGEAVRFGTFLLICAALAENRFSKAARQVFLAVLALVLAVQAVLVLSGQETLALTLTPLTAYLPMIILLHIFSGYSFAQTCVIWSAGCIGVMLMGLWGKLTYSTYVSGWMGLNGMTYGFVFLTGQLLGAAGLVLMAYRVIRPSFRRYARVLEDGWLAVLFPMLLTFLLLSWFSASSESPAVRGFIMLAALSVFFVVTRVMILSAALGEAKATQREIRHQLAMQRRNHESLCRKMELDRIYHHDFRHHMLVLEGFLKQNRIADAERYLQDLNGRLDSLRPRAWCANVSVNAVLNSCIGRAEESGCTVDAQTPLPDNLPCEEMDLCIILSNALENAIHACMKLPERERQIVLRVELTENNCLTVFVENPCPEPVKFDADGFPVSGRRREGHGLGLRSVRYVAGQYGGLMRCQWQEGRFSLRVILFPQDDAKPKERKRRPGAAALVTGVILCCVFLNASPALAAALETVPVVGALVRVVDLRTWSVGWGGTELEFHEPQVEGTAAGVREANEQFQALMEQMEEKFLWYAARKYEGYVGTDVDYTVLRDDEKLLILRFNATLNAGGSADYSRHVVLDKASGQVLELGDLFLPDVNYVFLLSREITAQMQERMNANDGIYFLPGGMWPEEDCFRQIDPDQDFYFDADGNLVIVFEEYTVAPGSMGAPEFTIPLDLLAGYGYSQ